MKNTIEYKLIAAHYGTRVAERSQVPLINHIDEGLVILEAVSASEAAKRAYCLHPLLQGDADLYDHYLHVVHSCEASSVLLAMEYRSVANEFLSPKMDTEEFQTALADHGYAGAANLVRLSPLSPVNDMLVADKVQNYKDFVTYHKGTHPRSRQLDDYFNIWLECLGIDAPTYDALCKRIDRYKNEQINQ